MISVNKFKLLASDKKIIVNALKKKLIISVGSERKKFEDKFKKLN